MTKQREWPNNAREQRDQAAEAAVTGIKALKPLVDGVQVDRTDVVRRQARALSALERIAFLLYAAGAPIRPEAIHD